MPGRLLRGLQFGWFAFVALLLALVAFALVRTALRSGVAAEKLAALGFRNVSQYEEGLQGWNEAGHPVEEATAQVAVE